MQGLRAVAVALVIGTHLIGRPSGGFVGVDVFFVISGYLITGLLLREHAKSGRISLSAFYLRRLKRITPAATATIALTLAAAALLFSRTHFVSTLEDGFWAAISLGNWHFIAIGTDYMHATDSVSPLQHFWSLAVEEQFYLIWPIVLIVALKVGHRAPRASALGAIVMLLILSMGWAAWQSAVDPTPAYFSSLTRGWELCAGALLAIVAPRLPRGVAVAAAALGVLLIGAGAVVLDSTSPFPFPGALLPVGGAVTLIAAGGAGGTWVNRFLGNRLLSTVGDYSYSLYLWHFPTIVFLAVLIPERGHRFLLLALVVTCLAAVASYHLVEEPLRHMTLGRGGLRLRARIRVNGRQRWAGVLAGGLALLVMAVAVSSHKPAEVRAVNTSYLTSNTSSGAVESKRVAAVAEALTMSQWPAAEMRMTTGDEDDRAPEWIRDGCLGDERGALADSVSNAERCSYGARSAPHRAVLLGDSVAISWMPGLREALGPSWSVDVWTEQQCPAVDVDILRGDGTSAPSCARLRAGAQAHVEAERPDLVILTSSFVSLTRLADGRTGDAAGREWRSGTERTLRALSPHAGRIVLLDPPPDLHPVATCRTPLSSPADCVSGVTSPYLAFARSQREAVLSANLANVRYPDTLQWFCEDGRCPSFVGGDPVSADGRHLSRQEAVALKPVLREALDGGTPRGIELASFAAALASQQHSR